MIDRVGCIMSPSESLFETQLSVKRSRAYPSLLLDTA